MPTVFGHEVGPTGGAQAIRDGAGYRTGVVTIFPGSSPGSFTRIQPSMTQAAIQAAIDGDTTGKVWWEAGLYRGPWNIIDTSVFRLYTKANQEHRFQTGPNRTSADTAIIQGSEAVPTWVNEGTGFWFATSQSQDFTSRHNSAGPDPYHNDHPPAGHNLEAFYRDGVQLYPAATKAAVTGRSDSVFFDRVAARAYVGSNPAGHSMERLADFAFIFRIRVPNVTFKGGIFRHAGFAMIHPEVTGGGDPTGFRIEDAELCYGRLNGNVNGGGISGTYTGAITISHCTLHHGGRYNFNLTWTIGSVVEFCELYAGNWMHFGNRVVGTFDEGSDKTLFTDNFIYRKNWMHDNDGPSAWPDTQCNTFTFEDNVCENEFGAGIHYEQNNVAAIRRNYFKNVMKDGNQPAPFDGTVAGWPTLGGWSYKGGGIWCSVASNVEIYDNWFFDCKHAALYARQDFVAPAGRVFNLENMNFHHNRIDHWDSGSAQEYMISYRDSRAILPVPEPPTYTETASDEAYAVVMARANNVYNFNDYHVRALGREDAPTRPADAWFFAPSGINKDYTAWRQGFIVQHPSADAGPGSQGSPASFHDPSSNFTADLPPVPGGSPVPVPAQETDTAQTVTPLIVQPLTQVSETDSPISITLVESQPGFTQIIPLVTETDGTLVVTPRFRSGWSQVAQATTPSASGAQTIVLLIASETDSVFGLEGVALSLVSELDEAQAVTVRRRLGWAGPVSVTTLTEGGVIPVFTIDVAQVEELDAPLGLEGGIVVGIAQVSEEDVAATVVRLGTATGEPPGNKEMARRPVQRMWRARVQGTRPNDVVRR